MHRYRMFTGGMPKNVWSHPVYSADMLRDLAEEVRIHLGMRRDWVVLDSHKSFTVVPRETVLRVCGLS